MSQRTIRVNELVKREISDILHTHYKDNSVYITITDVQVVPDLRKAWVYYSVIGDEERRRKAHQLLMKNRKSIRQELSRRVILKYLPELYFEFDDSIRRGANVLEILDQIDSELPPEGGDERSPEA